MKTIARIFARGIPVLLQEDGTWKSEDLSTQKIVQARFSAGLFDSSPRDGFQRFDQAKAAGDFYQSPVSFFGRSSDIPGRVY